MIGTSTSRQRNTASTKAILSGLYAAWSSDVEGLKRIKGAIEEAFVIAARESSKGDFTLNGSATRAGGKDGVSRHADPATGLTSSLAGQPQRSTSPPAQSPGKPSRRRSEERTPSPARLGVAAVAPARFMGVDELDHPHRAGSPGITPGPPHVRAVVDPSVPLPHGAAAAAAGTLSPPGAGGAAIGVDTTLTAAMAAIDLTGSLDKDGAATIASLRDSLSGRFVHGSGSFAVLPSADIKQATLRDVPTFYTRNESHGVLSEPLEEEMSALASLLTRGGEKVVNKQDFGEISIKVFKVPMWFKDALFEAIAVFAGVQSTVTSLTSAQVRRAFNEVYATRTPSRRLFELILGDLNRDHITIDDLKTMTKRLIECHPGLEFLHQPEFQEYYCRTVAIRIMYALERQQCRKIFWRDFDRSNLPEVMMQLDAKDVNQVMEYFSYEHFYVLYCKFWELDTDRDLLVDYNDLCNYGQGAVVPAVIKRVVEGYGRPLTSGESGRLDFEDFVYFCLSEEDKNTEPAVFYWFKVLDMDGDGVLSGYELGVFFRENEQRFLEYSDSPDEEVAYGDIMCQMLDMLGFDRIKTRKFGVTLGDLRACPTPANFFNMIFNAPKFMMFEHRDPFSEHQRRLQIEKTDWDRFAREEYDRMAAEA